MRTIHALSLAFSLALPGAAQAANGCQWEETEELTRTDLNLSLGELCQLYASPVNARLEPVVPFVTDARKADLRREQGNQIFDNIKQDEVAPSPVAAALEGWVNGLIHAGRLAGVTEPVRLFEIDQRKVCERETQAKYGAYVEGAGDEKTRQGLLGVIKEQVEVCLRRNYGYANFASREIVLGGATLARLGEGVSRFAVLHELCHIQNPAISGQAYEEIYCDAVALRWQAERLTPAELGKMKKEFSRLIRPENPFEELLVMRSQLPLCCK